MLRAIGQDVESFGISNADRALKTAKSAFSPYNRKTSMSSKRSYTGLYSMRRARTVLTVVIAFAVTYTAFSRADQVTWRPSFGQTFPKRVRDRTVVSIKTGVSIADQRIPAQFSIERPEIPKRLVYADGPYQVGKIPVHDAYVDISDELRQQDGFKLYEDIQTALRHNRVPKGEWYDFWNLARYLDPHVVGQTYKRFPTQDWYVVQDDDGYVFWPTLLRLLNDLNPNDELWIGKHDLGVNTSFAHGGGCYVISKELMRLTYGSTDDFASLEPDLYTKYFAGDIRLGRAITTYPTVSLKNVTHGGRSMFFTENPYKLSYSAKSWHAPVIALGHVADMHYAQLARADDIITKRLGRNDDARTCDLYSHFLPEEFQFLSWDNLRALSTRDEPIPYLERFKIVPFRQVNTQRTTPVDAASMSICSYLCDFADDCVSFTYYPSRLSSQCVISRWSEFTFGEEAHDAHAAFHMERIAKALGPLDCDSKEQRDTAWRDSLVNGKWREDDVAKLGLPSVVEKL